MFRPSVIFGPEDRFLNLFARLAAFLPVLALASPGARFQPVYVGDVVQRDARRAGRAATSGTARRYDLCGPQEYTLRELVEFVCAVTGRRRLVIGLPDSLSYLQAWAMELLPVKLLTRDNLLLDAGAERVRLRVPVRHPAGGAGSCGARLARALGAARTLPAAALAGPAASSVKADRV